MVLCEHVDRFMRQPSGLHKINSVRHCALTVPCCKQDDVCTWKGHVASIFFYQTSITVCTIEPHLLNFAILLKTVRGGTLVVPPWYPLFISDQYHYAGTWTGHVTSIWHTTWFDQSRTRVCTIALLLPNFAIFEKSGQRGYPSGTPMVPPVHISLIPVCRHMDRTCSLHMAYSSIWSKTVCTVAVHLVKFQKTARVTPCDQPTDMSEHPGKGLNL